MIISASRRTDLPAYYSDWFFQRIKEGFVLARNPMRYHQVSKISLMPSDVDGIVFWTKNPAPMLDRLELINSYTYYFQFTLTSYGGDLEPDVPNKNNHIIPTFLKLSDRIGPDRIIWRYDPILLSSKYTREYHLEYFYQISRRLYGYTTKCIFSFLDDYRGATLRLNKHHLLSMDEDCMNSMAASLHEIAHEFGLTLETCAEKIDLQDFQIGHAKCIDGNLLSKLRGTPLLTPKDRNQRPHCGCDASVDIGMYNTCKNGCLYCYANHSPGIIAKATAGHDPLSPLLSGQLSPDDVILDRKK